MDTSLRLEVAFVTADSRGSTNQTRVVILRSSARRAPDSFLSESNAVMTNRLSEPRVLASLVVLAESK